MAHLKLISKAIVSTALKTLEPFSASDEQNIETDLSTQVPENSVEDTEKFVNVPGLSEHSLSQDIPCPSGCVDGQQNKILTLSGYESAQQTETGTSLDLIKSALVTVGVMDSAYQLNSGNISQIKL
jgi:hypothetical protein